MAGFLVAVMIASVVIGRLLPPQQRGIPYMIFWLSAMPFVIWLVWKLYFP